MENTWPIEIDGLPMKNGGSFHGYVSHNQMVNGICVSAPFAVLGIRRVDRKYAIVISPIYRYTTV